MIVNQYSFVFVVVVLLGGTTIWAYQSNWQLSRLLVVAGVLVATLVVMLVSHRTASQGAIPNALSGDKIVLVEYYSDY